MRNCPFCGAPASRLRLMDKWTGKGAYRGRSAYVRCLDCNARGPTVGYGQMFDVRNERPGVKKRVEVAALAAIAWDGGKPPPDPDEFRLEGLTV